MTQCVENGLADGDDTQISNKAITRKLAQDAEANREITSRVTIATAGRRNEPGDSAATTCREQYS